MAGRLLVPSRAALRRVSGGVASRSSLGATKTTCGNESSGSWVVGERCLSSTAKAGTDPGSEDASDGKNVGATDSKVVPMKLTASEQIAANKEKHAADVKLYKTDTQTLANWLDMSIVKIKGRIRPADTIPLPVTNSMCLPFLPGTTAVVSNTEEGETQEAELAQVPQTTSDPVPLTTLRKTDTTLSELIGGSVGSGTGLRLVTFSFKQYGHSHCEAWMTAMEGSPILADRIPVFNLCFVEYGFMSFVKGAFVSSLRGNIPDHRWSNTGLVFGSVELFASNLLLPNKYIGYAYLVDLQNRVRWRGFGAPTAADIAAMEDCGALLLKEEAADAGHYTSSRSEADMW